MIVKGICFHWTANTASGADARAHEHYFAHAKTKVHYVVDDKEFIQLLPLDVAGIHAGTQEGNSHYIAIEMCVNDGSDWVDTLRNVRKAVQDIESKIEFKFGAPIYRRHYDFTGKDCPKMLVPTIIKGKDYNWNWELFQHLMRGGIDEIETVHEIRTVETPITSITTSKMISELLSRIFNSLTGKK